MTRGRWNELTKWEGLYEMTSLVGPRGVSLGRDSGRGLCLGEEAELDRTWEFLIASYCLTVGSASPREEYEPSLEP